MLTRKQNVKKNPFVAISAEIPVEKVLFTELARKEASQASAGQPTTAPPYVSTLGEGCAARAKTTVGLIPPVFF